MGQDGQLIQNAQQFQLIHPSNHLSSLPRSTYNLQYDHLPSTNIPITRITITREENGFSRHYTVKGS